MTFIFSHLCAQRNARQTKIMTRKPDCALAHCESTGRARAGSQLLPVSSSARARVPTNLGHTGRRARLKNNEARPCKSSARNVRSYSSCSKSTCHSDPQIFLLRAPLSLEFFNLLRHSAIGRVQRANRADASGAHLRPPCSWTLSISHCSWPASGSTRSSFEIEINGFDLIPLEMTSERARAPARSLVHSLKNKT